MAKAALRRLAMEKLEPTPENYSRAYLLEAGGQPPPVFPSSALPMLERLVSRALSDAGANAQSELRDALSHGEWERADGVMAAQGPLQDNAAQAVALSDLIDKIVRGVQQGGRQWTSARKKDSLQRVLSSTRTDVKRLQQRLGQLVAGWASDTPDDNVETDAAPFDEAPQSPASSPPSMATISLDGLAAPAADLTSSGPLAEATAPLWNRMVNRLGGTVQQGLPPPPAPSAELADELTDLAQRIGEDGPTELQADELDQLCLRATRVLQHRHHLVDQLGHLCEQLSASLADLSEDDSWAKGQVDAMRQEIEHGLTARSVRSVSELLDNTRKRQQALRVERGQARDALKSLINQMLSELGELGSQTGRFHESLGRYAGVIEKADSLESLAGVVREMVSESRTVQTLVAQAQGRLQYEHARATGLSERVVELETELRRLSEEVSTDQLTQIANRRGLMQAFDAEKARQEREGSELSIGLLDVDNFKRLNDELGHNAGDQALKALADVVSKTLRPTDLVARFGGEEFVVLLPNTPLEEGEQILTRLQRSLTGGLFMHEQKQVFVTFSAGVTAYRQGERIEIALERADEALYEAKRTGKNRTCVG
ncbi:MAG: diguanylate cyclase [Pseudomonadota bacterium]